MAKKYITTPIYYINANPHLGHAYASIAADILARYYRKKGEKVYFLTGTDEHGAKNALVAEKEGISPQEFADRQSKKFAKISKVVNLSNDDFIRTTDPRHEKIVREFIQKLYDKKFIYKKEYEGWYCIGCEEFKTEKDLVDGCCPVHKTKAVKQKEENWFFKLSKFQGKIKDLIEKDKIKILPKERKNEILGKINLGLEDISISRTGVSWGVKVPWDEKQTVYVWVDALLNYYSAPIIFGKYEFWPPDIHFVGKEIMWFHAIIWPAILLAAEESLPKIIFVHGLFSVDGHKMSKSIGNVIDPKEMKDEFGTDAVRYYVMREISFGEDGDVSVARIKERYNNDLAAGLGNLVQRVLSMVVRYKVKVEKLPPACKRLSAAMAGRASSFQQEKIHNLTESFKFQEALVEIWKEIARINKEIADTQPWQLAKDGEDKELEEFLKTKYCEILAIADLVEPYLPETAEKIKNQAKTLKPVPIFQKIE